MYFLTLNDPDYMVKGSRDPLGFQVLWQQAGRELIPYLSTVSTQIEDFQVMALAEYCRQRFPIPDTAYAVFFTCFEQLMAYTRFVASNGNASFNGVDKVRRVMSGNERLISISANSSDQLLSSQRSYGIWGKYNRPFTDMDIAGDKAFADIQQRKLDAAPGLRSMIQKLVDKRGQRISVSLEQLQDYTGVFIRPTGRERTLYRRFLLTDKAQGELLALTDKTPSIVGLPFYHQLDWLQGQTENSLFGSQIALLRNTERILSPLNRIFRYLQDAPYWQYNDIAADPIIAGWSANAPTGENTYLPLSVRNLLGFDNLQLVLGLVARNSEVCARRGSEAWLTPVSDGIEVNHFEGAFTDEDYQPMSDNDYGYFLNTWFNLYRQLN
jgi:hypothetical protein